MLQLRHSLQVDNILHVPFKNYVQLRTEVLHTIDKYLYYDKLLNATNKA